MSMGGIVSNCGNSFTSRKGRKLSTCINVGLRFRYRTRPVTATRRPINLIDSSRSSDATAHSTLWLVRASQMTKCGPP